MSKGFMARHKAFTHNMAGGMMEEQEKQGRWPNSKKGNDLKLPVDVSRCARIKELADCAADEGLTLHHPRAT